MLYGQAGSRRLLILFAATTLVPTIGLGVLGWRMVERRFFWDGRVPTLEEQVLKPIEDPNEMDLPLQQAASRVNLTVRDHSYALASFVRSLLFRDAPYDRFLNGDRAALTSVQQAGLQLFRGKANCTSCHVGPNLTDESLHNTGVAWLNGKLADEGAGDARGRGILRSGRKSEPAPRCRTTAIAPHF